MINFEQYKKSGVRAFYHRVPIEYLDEFRSEMAKQGVYYCGCNLFGSSSDYESEVVFSGTLPEFVGFCNVAEVV